MWSSSHVREIPNPYHSRSMPLSPLAIWADAVEALSGRTTSAPHRNTQKQGDARPAIMAASHQGNRAQTACLNTATKIWILQDSRVIGCLTDMVEVVVNISAGFQTYFQRVPER